MGRACRRTVHLEVIGARLSPRYTEKPAPRFEQSRRRGGHDVRLLSLVAVFLTLALATAGGLFALAAYYPDRYRELARAASSFMQEQSDPDRAAEVSDASSRAPAVAPDGAAGDSVAAAPAQEARPEPPRLPIPNADGMVMLIRKTLNALNQANKTSNYSIFRELSGSDFQQANSGARLSDAFAELRGRNVDLLALNVINPRLIREPWIDDDGRLHLTGLFPSRPEQINFDLIFQPENNTWRPFGVAVDTAPLAADASAPQEAEPAPPVVRREPPATKPQINRDPQVPDEATMAALARDAVMALNQANTTGNYAVLRELGAPGFQEFNTGAQLADAFAELRSRQLDLGPTAVIGPQLFRPPSIDERGMLRMTGYFPSRPEQVNFDLAFQMVDGEWKIFGIGVNTSRLVPAGEGAGGPGGADGAAATSAGGTNSGGGVPTPAQVPAPTPRPRPGP